MNIHYYDSIEVREVTWLWKPYIPCGKITIVQGDPGEGKTTLMLQIAAMMTSGRSIPDSAVSCEPQNVIYQGAEDGLEDTIKPRLVQAGADCSRVAFIDTNDRKLCLGDKRFLKAIKETNAKLMIIDPMQAFLRGSTELQQAGGLRDAFNELSKVAEETGCAIVLIGHMNKNNRSKSIYRGLGSIDLVAAARSVLMVSRDREDPTLRVIFPVKISLAPEGSAYAFRLDPESGFKWVGEYEYSEDDLLGNLHYDKKVERAKRYLMKVLEEDMPSAVVTNQLVELGISKRTVATAKKDLGIESYKEGDIWYWHLPD